MAKKLKSGNASSSKRESSLPIPIILAISITIIGISLSLLNNYNWGRSSESSLSSPPSTPSFPSNPSTLPDKTADTIPTYDEYLILAKQHHWIPSDPLQKLKDVSYKSSQIINLYNSTQTHEYMKLISQEVQFLLQVLIKSTNHTFDLTEIFFESLEGIHRTFYHLEKQLLQHNKERVVTRAEAEYYTKQYLYMFTSSIMKATLSKKGPIPTHITIDLNRPIGREGLPAVATAVSLRLYRLYLPLLEVGATPEGALLSALKNYDYLSIAMLLNVSNPLLFSPSKDNGLPREIEFACTSTQLLPTTIQQLYSKYISLFNMTTNTTLSCPSLQSHTRTPAPIPKSSDSLPQDFLQTPLAYLDESIPRCPIDVIRIQQSHNDETKYDDGIQTISMNDYYSNYIQKKIPVVIRGIIDKSDHHWSFPSLMKVGERLKVMPKSIPYEDQLSSNSESQPIRLCDYLKEMRNYSQIVREWLLTTPDATYFLTRFGGLNSEYPYQIPRYVFDNQLLSSKELVSSTLSSPFAKETSKVEDVPNRLYDDIIQATYDHLHSHSSTSSYEPHTSFNYTVTKQFYLGPPLSGAPFHAHGPAYNALFSGRKLWFLLPPGSDLYSNIPPLKWAQHMESPLPEEVDESQLQNLSNPPQLCAFLQYPGDVFFVPSLYSHQILNLDETIGFATEIHYQGR